MLNIVVPMAGRGSRFAEAGYKDPKPLISVMGKPMIERVIENLTPICEHKFIFVCQEKHAKTYGLQEMLPAAAPGCEVVLIDRITEGAASTVLTAEKYIDNDDPLMIANSDQLVHCDINSYLEEFNAAELDGLIMTMTASDPKWSFVTFDRDHLVTEVREKEVISNEATVGIYNFSKGSDFVSSAKIMIENKQKSNNEYYVAPTYNILISQGARIGIFNIGNESDGMSGLGTPDDLQSYLSRIEMIS